MNETLYAATIVAGCHAIELTEVAAELAESRRLELRAEGRLLGQLQLLASEYPSFSFGIQEGASELVIWTESKVYLLKMDLGQIFSYDHFDAIQAAYLIRGKWCLVGDASVSVVDIAVGVEITRYEHDEIITASSWIGQDLVVEDLQGRSFRFTQIASNPSSLEVDPVSV